MKTIIIFLAMLFSFQATSQIKIKKEAFQDRDSALIRQDGEEYLVVIDTEYNPKKGYITIGIFLEEYMKNWHKNTRGNFRERNKVLDLEIVDSIQIKRPTIDLIVGFPKPTFYLSLDNYNNRFYKIRKECEVIIRVYPFYFKLENDIEIGINYTKDFKKIEKTSLIFKKR